MGYSSTPWETIGSFNMFDCVGDSARFSSASGMASQRKIWPNPVYVRISNQSGSSWSHLCSFILKSAISLSAGGSPDTAQQIFSFGPTWWCEFFHSRKGYSFLLWHQWVPLPDLSFIWCCRYYWIWAILGKEWFVGQWLSLQMPLSIAYK